MEKSPETFAVVDEIFSLCAEALLQTGSLATRTGGMLFTELAGVDVACCWSASDRSVLIEVFNFDEPSSLSETIASSDEDENSYMRVQKF